VLFLSSRDSGNTHLFRTSLRRRTEDPDDPLVRERRRETQTTDTPKSEGQQAIPALVVETEGIGRRAVQLTTGASVRSPILSKDGKTVYFLSSDDAGAGLFSISVDGEDRKKIAGGAFQGLTLSADGKLFFYRQGSNIYKFPVKATKGDKLAFEFTVTVDKRAEWRQMFEESWRTMKYRFYDENMHGTDWDAARRTYLPLLDYVGQNQDLYDLCNELIGELNASHTGVSGPSGIASPSTYQTRLLGFEMEPDGDHLRVTHVYRDGPADKEWLSIKPGDYVLAIDGQGIGARDNYWKVLNHVLNDYVSVEIAARPTGPRTTQRIKTVPSLRDTQYQAWVEGNRAYGERISEGNVAYVHFRSMNQASLAVFENDIDRFWNAKSIIIDIRYNGGGNIDQQLLDILERRPYEYWNSRWGGRARGRRPRQAIAGPKVMVTNWRSASDSEVTPLGFRDLGLGRIVGNPTNGSVIATGSYSLINGASIRTPGSLVVSYDPTKPNNYGVNLENYGVAPDVWAENTPADELAGFDRELKAAVDEALRMLASGKWQFDGGK
jgi:tricorn protease